MALVVVGHSAALAGLQWQTWLGAVERLDLAFLINRYHHSVRERVHVEAYDVLDLAANAGSLDFLKVPMRCGWRRLACQMRCTALRLIPTTLATIATRPVGRRFGLLPHKAVANTRAMVAGGNGILPGLRVLSRKQTVNAFLCQSAFASAIPKAGLCHCGLQPPTRSDAPLTRE